MNGQAKGFTAVEAIIIVVVVLALGLGGWFVWQSNKKDEPAAKAGSNTAASTDVDSNQEGATKYLDIPEWGIKFALTADTADAYYDDTSTSALDSFSLRSHSLDSAPDCTTAPHSVAAIFRVAKDAPNEDGRPDKLYRETQDGQVIGDYFYFISGAQYACTEDPELAVVLQAVRNSFITAGPTIQKD